MTAPGTPYQCRLLDEGDRVVHVHELRAADDRAACDAAEAFAAGRQEPRYEVWRGGLRLRRGQNIPAGSVLPLS